MPPKNNRFKQGSGAFRCSNCGKLTRDTGNQEASLRMCKHCIDEGEWENFLSDGGDPADLPDAFKYLAE